MKLKVQDKVKVLAGKDKGKTSVISRVLKKRHKVVAEKVNIVTKHIKKSSSGPGQKIQFEAPVDSSNLMLLCPRCDKPTRVGYRMLENGRKERVCKKCEQPVDGPVTKKA
jgi:large subunit ribosomal protein L24